NDGADGNYNGAYIMALDLVTGKEAWRFKTIPHPGEVDGDTWNDAAPEKRTGASVWNVGSYDAELNLVYFGVAQTYDTDVLHTRAGKAKNDGLYTNSTVALDADTGKLVWHFQHM